MSLGDAHHRAFSTRLKHAGCVTRRPAKLIWGTTQGTGPFVVDQPVDSLVRLCACALVRWCAFTMAVQTTEDGAYKISPSPRNRHRTIFLHRVLVLHAYMLIDLEGYRYSLSGWPVSINRAASTCRPSPARML